MWSDVISDDDDDDDDDDGSCWFRSLLRCESSQSTAIVLFVSSVARSIGDVCEQPSVQTRAWLPQTNQLRHAAPPRGHYSHLRLNDQSTRPRYLPNIRQHLFFFSQNESLFLFSDVKFSLQISNDINNVKPGFNYPSWRPELTARVDGWPVSITRVDGRAFPLAELT